MRTHPTVGLGMIWLAATLSSGCTAGPTLTGTWDATVVVNELEVPFRFEITQNEAGVSAAFFNGDERLESTGGQLEDGKLTLEFDHLATTVRAQLVEGQLDGQYDRSPRTSYAFRARRAEPPAAVPADIPSIGGLWRIPVESSKGESAWRFIVRQDGAEVSAAILRVDGDTGALTGRYQDGRFVVSHFSGHRPLLLDLTLMPDGSLEILRNKRDTLTAVRDEEAVARHLPLPTDPEHHSTVKNPDEVFQFSFPDADGRIVSNTDDRFRNKVVIVSITGTWCPNCHDEAPFLSELYRKYRGLGLEIVALSFEEAPQLENPTRLRAYAERYGIEYPMLLVGVPEQLAEKVPQIDHLDSFPTSIFLGRDGRVRTVHAGFPSPASGAFFTETKDQIRALVERLLTENAPVTTQ